MVVVYKTEDATTPDETKNQMHEYHSLISSHVDVDVIGCTGMGSKIETIIFSESMTGANKSDLESWLNSTLYLEAE